jgi:hypothetical protein
MGMLKGENKECVERERERWQQKQRRLRTEEDEDRKGERGLGSDYDTSISPWLTTRLLCAQV